MRVSVRIAQEGFGGGKCWTQSRMGVIGNEWVLTTQQLTLAGSDVYGLLHSRYSTDGGITFSPLVPQEALVLPDRTYVDTVPAFHAQSGTLISFGQGMVYKGANPLHPELDIAPQAYWSRYEPLTHSWQPAKMILDAQGNPVENTNAGCSQRYDLPNGDILLPLYRRMWVEGKRLTYVQVLRLAYENGEMVMKAMGNEIHADDEPRGFAEPSLIFYRGRFYLTLRSDTKASICTSEDGLHYTDPIPWTWDTGVQHPNYNTQQHWVVGGDKLYLVYTRPNGQNDHVFRHRAPLYMAQVDVSRLCVLRHTERAITPERGARMGNFGITELSADRSIVVTTEWMQPLGCERHGSNNAIYLADCQWDEQE